MVNLFDEDFENSVNFRCYLEESIVPKCVVEIPIDQSQHDDDCKTQENEIEVCLGYLAFQLEQSIRKEPCII